MIIGKVNTWSLFTIIFTNKTNPSLYYNYYSIIILYYTNKIAINAHVDVYKMPFIIHQLIMVFFHLSNNGNKVAAWQITFVGRILYNEKLNARKFLEYKELSYRTNLILLIEVSKVCYWTISCQIVFWLYYCLRKIN